MSIKQVHEFNTTFGVRMLNSRIPEEHSANVRVPEAQLRFGLIKEELHEFLDAFADCDIVELLDALGDIEYVVDGAALVFGLVGTMTQTFELVAHSSTTPSERFILREDTVKHVIEDLRIAILRDNAVKVGEILGLIKGYVYNTAHYYGVYVPSAVDAIHESNMSKLGTDGKPIYREGDGKVMKGPDYKTPTNDLRQQLFGEYNAPANK